MARSSNSSACACAGSPCKRSTSASVRGAAKTRGEIVLAVRAAAAARELFARGVNEVIRHARKPIIADMVTKNTPSDAAAEVCRLGWLKIWPDVWVPGCGDT